MSAVVRRRIRTAIALCLLAAACAKPVVPSAPPAPPPPAPFDRAGTLAAAAAALDRGDVVPARAGIAALLAHDPADREARILLDGLDVDPRVLLGATSRPYRLKPDETIADVAARLLGTRLRAYALARYNGLSAPVAALPRMVLRIPGPAPAAPRRAVRPPAKRAAVDPAGAVRSRAAALSALARGRKAEAIALMRAAVRLDPANPLIRRDLARLTRR